MNCQRILNLRLAIACLAILTGATSLAAEETFGPQHVARQQSVLAAEISPNGKHVAYTLAVPRLPLDEPDGPAWVELHVTDAAGKSRPFVTGKVNVNEVQWTPDGQGIAFVAKRGDDANTSLYIVPVDGGEARKAVKFDGDLHGVAFSPDGKQVAFLAAEPLSKEQKDYREKGFNQEIYEEDWRPEKVWIAPLDGSSKPRSLDLPGSASQVKWNPVQRQLAVVLAPTALVDDSYMFKRLRVVDVDSGKVIDAIENPGKLGEIAWSPDGKHLAMIAGADVNDPSEGRLMIAAVPGGGKPRDLMPQYEAHVEAIAWKDAKTLVWVASRGVISELGAVDLDGKREVLYDGNGPVLASLSLSDDGRSAAAVGHSPQHPPEVFRFADGLKKPERLTKHNPWLEKMRLARQEPIRWKARDGLELEGVLVYPLNYQEGRRYPLILYVHGGPEAHVSNGWITNYTQPGQVGAARGMASFYPNYRGSTGRGVAFSKLGQADAAGKEFDDLIDGVDHLVAQGLVQKDKVGITGGSYGGYASAWGATFYSDRFAAAVMFVGISDVISKLGTTDIPEEMFLVHHLKRLWDDWDYFARSSPIRHVQKNRTPTLILHGKADPRVHPSQSLELFRHLKTLKQAPVRLVLYPGEGHGNRRAASRLDYHLRMLRWMEHYLQGPGGDAPKYEIDYAKELGIAPGT